MKAGWEESRVIGGLEREGNHGPQGVFQRQIDSLNLMVCSRGDMSIARMRRCEEADKE